MTLAEIKTKLTEFIIFDKFREYQELQPAVENSTPETVELVNGIFNKVAEEIVSLINSNNYADSAVKEILVTTMSRIDDEQLDTEDHEFGYELIIVLSKITGVSIEDELF